LERNVGSAIQEFDGYSLILKAHHSLQKEHHCFLFYARIIESVSVPTHCFFSICLNIIFALVPRYLTSSFPFKIFSHNFLSFLVAIIQATLTERKTYIFLIIGHVCSQTKWPSRRHVDNVKSTRYKTIGVTKISTVITTNNSSKLLEILYYANRNTV
jgi:uncharacterized membrane protein YeaQ/YmgE (transglycosylase-associated protein family)